MISVLTFLGFLSLLTAVGRRAYRDRKAADRRAALRGHNESRAYLPWEMDQ